MGIGMYLDSAARAMASGLFLDTKSLKLSRSFSCNNNTQTHHSIPAHSMTGRESVGVCMYLLISLPLRGADSPLEEVGESAVVHH